MRFVKLAIAGSLLGGLLIGIAVADEASTLDLRQPASVQQTAFEYDSYAYFAPEGESGDSPSDQPAAQESSCEASCGQPSCSTCCSCCDPCWTVHADGMFLQLNHTNVPLVLDNGGADVLNAGEFNFDYEAGWEIGVKKYYNENWDLELRYFSVDGWRAGRAAQDCNGFWVQYETPIGVGAASTVGGVYRSELDNLEINARRKMNPWLDIVFGFRYMELEESMVILETWNAGADVGIDAVDATNYLFGFQLGADATVLSRGNLDLECAIKTGVFGNDGRNSATSTNVGGATLTSSAGGSHTAFAAELAVTAKYQLTDALAARVGYELLWVEGVASAYGQVATSDPGVGAAVNFRGSPFYDGLFFGLEAAW